MKNAKGFTLVELMTVVIIIGILAAIGVPKMGGVIAKAKASELPPAAATYIKLQSAYVSEYKAVGTWRKIGYIAPGKNGTSTFKYGKGEILSSVRRSSLTTTLGGDGKIGWTAENKVGLNGCKEGNVWNIHVIASDSVTLQFKSALEKSNTSYYCIGLMSGWETVDKQVAVAQSSSSTTPVSSTTNVEDEEPTLPDEDPVEETNTAQCSKLNSWLSGVKGGWENENNPNHGCFTLRESLYESGDLVCSGNDKKGKCTGYSYASDEVECRVAGTKCPKEESGGSGTISTIAAGGSYKPGGIVSEADAKKAFGGVDVLCAEGKNKNQCTAWRRASECKSGANTGSLTCGQW